MTNLDTILNHIKNKHVYIQTHTFPDPDAIASAFGLQQLLLYKGNIIKAGTTSPYSLYSESLASFTTGELYDHHDADGFITLFGLPLKVRAMKMKELEEK